MFWEWSSPEMPKYGILFHVPPTVPAPINPLCSLSARAFMHIQNASDKIRDRMERHLRRFAMRRMSGAGDDRHIDRAVAFVLSDFDPADGPVPIVGALQDRNRHPDVGEVFRNIPVAEFRVEPGVVPAIEGVVDVAMP